MFKNLFLTVLSILVCALGLEIYVRAIADDGMQYDIEMWKYALQAKRVSPHPDIGHEHIPGARGTFMNVEIAIDENKHRYSGRRPAVAEPGKDRRRIMILGDSITLGWGVPYDETLAARMESWFRNDLGRNVEVINAGVGNYNVEMYVNYFIEEGWRFNPDIIVVNFFINDAEEMPSRKHWAISEFLYTYAYLYGRIDSVYRRYLGGADWKEYLNGLYDSDGKGERRVRNSLHKLVEFCRRRGIGVVVANIPELHALNPYPFLRVNSIIRKAVEDLDIPYIDFLAAVRGVNPASLRVSPSDFHPDGRANGLFMEEIKRHADLFIDLLDKK